MCVPKTPKYRPASVSTSAVTDDKPAIDKTDADIQKKAEDERRRRAYSTTGLPSLILTGGLGDTSGYTTRGVFLGV